MTFITLTLHNDRPIIVIKEHIVSIEKGLRTEPLTMVTLSAGKIIEVKETAEEIMKRNK